MKIFMKNICLLIVIIPLLTGCPDQDSSHDPGGNGLSGKIVFSANRDGDNEIYVIHADGSNLVQLTQNTVNDTLPDWSPDGDKILFGGNSLSVINSDGSNALSIENGKPIFSPRWY